MAVAPGDTRIFFKDKPPACLDMQNSSIRKGE